jgi:ParB family transcriptional regulator, chromosome partitioning protein
MDRRLGRGLNAMVPDLMNEKNPASESLATVGVDRIENNPYQPRKAFDSDELTSLSESIRTHGILQPLVVRPRNDGGYQLIAGERRLRAAQAAGITEVPVRVVDFNDQQVLEAALVENIQRADLNPIEKAQGFKEYLSRFSMTQEQLAARLGLDRTTVSNLVNLLDLPPEVQEAVRLGQITLGHAKLLKGLTDRARQVSLCKEIITRGHSVRATEGLIKQEKDEPAEEAAPPKPAANPDRTTHVQSMEDDLRRKLAVRVEIKLRAKDKGQIVLGFESNDDFERLMEVLRGKE